ncbi:ABC transporter G family member 22 [Apostasia shenzhenica]|uniref:ABC transporter G family member 22 n=1 Tax=Apostasia shenzhenica TaxID=1088818 RepID=A0A2I0B2W5_9ASPA|nr:ABC transporter G family member 22 [Apostasia shenzhenica]
MDEQMGHGIVRAKSEQLEKAATKLLSRPASAEAITMLETNGSGSGSGQSLSRKKMVGNSPGRKSSNHHIRKSRSGKLKLDLEDVSSAGAALSRASSASLGFSFSFTGFTAAPEDDIADIMRFSDDEFAVYPEAEVKQKRMIMEPTLPIYLKFTEVKYKVIIKGITSTEKDILNGITGSVRPGEVLALMGPSGSGKTTLLSLLGGRISGNVVEGSITYNDEPYNKSLKRRIGFVTQDDVLFAHLTVRETLKYAALLRLPKKMTKQQKEERAMDVIYELGLERCQDTMIGGPFVRGVSGGERKRVCIGNEILINPSLLFLDEPTSGLDSTTALRIVQVLHDMAEAGKTVITTIHQPSSRLFHKFDKLILLGKGSLLYFGKASEAMLYFQSIGCSPLIAMNPAEFLIDLATGNINDVSIPSELDDKVQTENSGSNTRNDKPTPKDVQEYLVEAYETRVANKEKKKLLMPSPIANELKAKVISSKREWGASWRQQFCILFCRGLKERKHDYLSWMRITQVITTAIILGLLWWQSNSTTPTALQDQYLKAYQEKGSPGKLCFPTLSVNFFLQAGLLFFIAVFWGFFPVFTAIFTFPQERAMLNKERAVGMYRLSAYFMARTTSDLPLDLFLPIIFLLIVYFMAGLKQTPEAFCLCMLIVFLSIIAAQYTVEFGAIERCPAGISSVSARPLLPKFLKSAGSHQTPNTKNQNLLGTAPPVDDCHAIGPTLGQNIFFLYCAFTLLKATHSSSSLRWLRLSRRGEWTPFFNAKNDAKSPTTETTNQNSSDWV